MSSILQLLDASIGRSVIYTIGFKDCNDRSLGIDHRFDFSDSDTWTHQFKLPTASDTSFGLVKTDFTADIPNSQYDVKVDDNGNAYANVPCLPLTGGTVTGDIVSEKLVRQISNVSLVTKMVDFDVTNAIELGSAYVYDVTDMNNKVLACCYYEGNSNAGNKFCQDVYGYAMKDGKEVSARNLLTSIILWDGDNNKFNSCVSVGETDESDNSLVINQNVTYATSNDKETKLATMGWVNNPDTSTNVVHRTGNETIGGDKTFSGNAKLSKSPDSDAIGHEVVDAAWVNDKFDECKVPATDSSEHIGIDSTSSSIEITPCKDYRVYRVPASGIKSLAIDLTNYNSNVSDIVECEVHV